MNELKVYGAALGALLVAAYVSWTDQDAGADAKITLVDIQPEMLERLDYVTTTQTVSLSFREIQGKRVPWFRMETKRTDREFMGSEHVPDLVKAFAPFVAERSLGELSGDELKLTELDAPSRKLKLQYKGKSKEFVLGGRTSGARDHYIQPVGSKEVLLIGLNTMVHLEHPDGKYMQRKLRNEPLKDVDKIMISAEAGTRTAFHKNRLSPRDAFWADEEKPDEKDETFANYVDKLEKLAAVEYARTSTVTDAAELVLEATWFNEDGEALSNMKLYREGLGKASEYWAVSSTTRLPVKVTRFLGEQLEQDLGLIF